MASTNALELGIDIGSLDACILVGYPGTIASLWQQAGRAGRGHEESVVFLIGQNAPVDQYLMTHSDYIFAQNPEQAVVDPDNPHISRRPPQVRRARAAAARRGAAALRPLRADHPGAAGRRPPGAAHRRALVLGEHGISGGRRQPAQHRRAGLHHSGRRRTASASSAPWTRSARWRSCTTTPSTCTARKPIS